MPPFSYADLQALGHVLFTTGFNTTISNSHYILEQYSDFQEILNYNWSLHLFKQQK